MIVKEFRSRFGSIINNGQGSMKGQIFRLAHLGYFDFPDLFAVIAEFEIILAANGFPVKFGTGVAACNSICQRRDASLAKEVNPRMKVLLAERLAPPGLSLLYQQEGWQIVESNPKEFMAHLADADALIVRSAIRITRELLAAAPNLRVIGRAGVGVDQYRYSSRYRRRRTGHENARRQCRFRRRTHARVNVVAGALHPPGQRIHQVRQVGK